MTLYYGGHFISKSSLIILTSSCASPEFALVPIIISTIESVVSDWGLLGYLFGSASGMLLTGFDVS